MFETNFDDDLLKSKHKRKQSISPQNAIKRKFPGPAGILPENSSLNNVTTTKFDEPFPQQNDMFLCSQKTVTDFQNGPWNDMVKDFSTQTTKFSIDWIKNQAALNRLKNKKGPFLAAVLNAVEIYDGKIPTVNVTLKDPSGEIQATILHNLYEKYSSDLIIGSVLILKQFSVLTAGNNNHYLTITSNNLVLIYNKSQKIKVQEFNVNEIDTCIEQRINFEVLRTKKEEQQANLFETNCDDLNFDIPDDFEEKLIEQNSSNQISVTKTEHQAIWNNVFEDVNAEDFFDDF